MNATLRLASPSERDLLVELMDEFHRESDFTLDRPAAERAFDALLADPALGRAWIVVYEGQTAGYVALSFGFSLEHMGRDARVDDFYLRPAFRGAGLGSSVLEQIEGEARSEGARALHVEVGRENAIAQHVYRKRGMRGHDDRELLTKTLL